MHTSRLRRWLTGTLVVGLVCTGIDLLLLGHYEDAWQFVPLVLIVAALIVLAWHAARPGPTAARALQATMILFLLASAAGLALHFQGAAEFQRDIDPSMPTWDLIKKVVRAKAPPLLAPGVMLQLGLIGLVYAYAFPTVTEPNSSRFLE